MNGESAAGRLFLEGCGDGDSHVWISEIRMSTTTRAGSRSGKRQSSGLKVSLRVHLRNPDRKNLVFEPNHRNKARIPRRMEKKKLDLLDADAIIGSGIDWEHLGNDATSFSLYGQFRAQPDG